MWRRHSHIVHARRQAAPLLGEAQAHLRGLTREQVKGMGIQDGIRGVERLLVLVRLLERQVVCQGERCYRHICIRDVDDLSDQCRLIRAHKSSRRVVKRHIQHRRGRRCTEIKDEGVAQRLRPAVTQLGGELDRIVRFRQEASVDDQRPAILVQARGIVIERWIDLDQIIIIALRQRGGE